MPWARRALATSYSSAIIAAGVAFARELVDDACGAWAAPDPQALAAVRALLNPDPAVAEMHARYDDPEAEADIAKRYAEDPLIP